MCYSAMVEARYREYLRLLGAEMDLEQFEQVYGQRLTDSSVRIPRAIDRWFDRPESAVEHRIRGHIDAYRTATVTRLETEIFAQRKRLAEAERKLATRATKAASESKRIAGDKISAALARLPLYRGIAPTALDARIFPFHHAPIVLEQAGRRVLRLARYHCRPSGKPPSIDRQYPGLYNARRDNLEKFWRGQFGSAHAVMLIESFFENAERDGRNQILHFVPRPAQPMRVACLYSEWTDPKDGRRLLSFAAVTDEPPAEVAAAGYDRMIVNLAAEAVDRWLAPEGRSAAELQALLDERERPYYAHQVLAA